MATALSIHLREHAKAFFAEFTTGPLHVQLIRHARRPHAQTDLFDFLLSNRHAVHSVVVKARLRKPTDGQVGETSPVSWRDRNDFNGALSSEVKTGYEVAALSAIASAFAKEPDDRFSAVNILDVLARPAAIVMEKRREPNLHRLLTRAREGASDRVRSAMRNAGAWLRRFHGFPDLPHTQPRFTDVSQLSEELARLAAYLREQGTGLCLSKDLIYQLKQLFLSSLSDPLPIGLSHGDFSLDNVLVDAYGRVTVLDTLAQWREPIYEDIGHFLFRLKFLRACRMSTGFGTLDRLTEQYEREFLGGYFTPMAVPLACIRLFECKHVLERWDYLLQRTLVGPRWWRIAQRYHVRIWSCFARRLVRRLLREATEAVAS